MTSHHKLLSAVVLSGLTISLLASCNGQRWTERQVGAFHLVEQQGGPTLSYTPSSGVTLLTDDGFAFKDLNRNDSLDAYEDWRLDAQTRAADLASKLSIEEIAGLMLYSSHQAVPASRDLATIDAEGEEKDSLLSVLSYEQKKFLNEDHLRAVLVNRRFRE